MAIETSLQPRQKWWNILYAIICGGLGIWGAYDYWVTIPRREADVAAYETAAAKREELEAKARAATAAPGGAKPLTDDEVKAGQAAKAVVDKGKPTAPAAYDRPVQMWLYVVGCGVLGTPWFLWQWLAAASKRYRIADDGTLEAGADRIAEADIADIDMTKWMSKSIATVVTKDGRRIELDDYKYKGMHLVIGSIASRFYPEAWTVDAKDLAKIRAEEADAAAGPADDTQPTRDVNA